MGTITTCDGKCGAMSPDPKTGLYVENGWLAVSAKREHGEYVNEKGTYCRECAHRILSAMAPLDKPLPPLKPVVRPLISTVGVFWLCVGAVVVWIILRGTGVA